MLEKDNQSFKRRRFVKTAGVLGVGSIAGCLGGSGESNANELTIGTLSEGSATYAMSQGMSSVISEHSDSLTLNAVPGPGSQGNIGQLARGEFDIAYTMNWLSTKIANGEEPFGDLNYQPCQLHQMLDTPYGNFFNYHGWTSFDDIEDGAKFNPSPRGTGTAEMLIYALDFVIERDSWEWVSLGYAEQPDALDEGRIDIATSTILNYNTEPSYLQDMKSRGDLSMIAWPDDALEKMRDDDRLTIQEVDMTKFDGYASVPETHPTPTSTNNFITRADAPYDPIYEYMTTMLENNEALPEYHALLEPFQDREWFAQTPFSDMPFHPAAADAFEEYDLWDDETMTRAEE